MQGRVASVQSTIVVDADNKKGKDSDGGGAMRLGNKKQWLGYNGCETRRGKEMTSRWLLQEGEDGIDDKRAYGSVFKQTLGLTFFLFRLPRLKGSPISLLPSRSSGLLISFFPQSLLEIDPFEPSHSQSPANSLHVPSLKRVFLRPSICFAFKKLPEEERIGDHRVLFAPIGFSWSQLARVPVPGTLDLAVGAPEALLGSFDWGPSGCSGA
ncbi:hypothetical protein BHM03_00044918 [Ensete ventricosum]|nr:hypothetical protein BHM03_00044918 [Ensete ventricosum]